MFARKAERPRRSMDEALDQWDDASDDNFENPAEPVMEDSDNEFSDLEEVDYLCSTSGSPAYDNTSPDDSSHSD